MSLTLRPMSRGDLTWVEAIYRQHAPQVPSADWLPVAHQAIAEGGEAPLAWVAVAEAGLVVGYVVGQVRSWEFGSAPAGWVIGIGVERGHQGGHVGAELLARLIESFRRRRAATVRTMVRRDDVKVLRFFRGAGFETGPYTQLEMEVSP